MWSYSYAILVQHYNCQLNDELPHRLMQLAPDMQQLQTQADGPQRVLRSHIEDAVRLRAMLGLPSSETNAYRLINR